MVTWVEFASGGGEPSLQHKCTSFMDAMLKIERYLPISAGYEV
jgi:hypothetical protein